MIKDCIHETANEVLDYNAMQKEENPQCYSEKIKVLVENKKKDYNKWLGIGRGEDWSREVKREITMSKNEL